MSKDDEFSEYLGARWSRFVRSAVLMGCSLDEAEDVVQTAMMRCLMHWGRVRRANDVDAYVYRVVMNTFTSARRRRWKGERPVAVVPDAPGRDETQHVDERDAVLRALSELNTDQRAVVVLRFYAQLSEKQTASVLGVAPGTVKSRLSRALKVLAENPDLAELRGTA